jgi:hypothetical protein
MLNDFRAFSDRRIKCLVLFGKEERVGAMLQFFHEFSQLGVDIFPVFFYDFVVQVDGRVQHNPVAVSRRTPAKLASEVGSD